MHTDDRKNKSSELTKFLCRIYIPQKDKVNITVNTLDEAFKVLKESGVRISSCKKYELDLYTEYHFNNSKNYIREFKTK